jgi:hypothetical protein
MVATSPRQKILRGNNHASAGQVGTGVQHHQQEFAAAFGGKSTGAASG